MREAASKLTARDRPVSREVSNPVSERDTEHCSSRVLLGDFGAANLTFVILLLLSSTRHFSSSSLFIAIHPTDAMSLAPQHISFSKFANADTPTVDVPMSVINRPLPSELSEEKVQQFMKDIQASNALSATRYLDPDES